MKKLAIIKCCIALLTVLAVLPSCKKLPNGYISPLIRYEEDPIIIKKGWTKVSSALNFDGATKPAKIKLIHIYDKATGAIVDDIFLKTYKIKGWKGLFNPRIDTTLEQVSAKQIELDLPAIVINEVSGQVEANLNTKFLPAGDYEYDLEISNSAGKSLYPKIGQLQILDAPPFEGSPSDLGSANNRMYKVGEESNPVLANTPIVTVTKIADDPLMVTLKLVDKNGTPFNPLAGEVLHRPATSSDIPFFQSLEEYAYQVKKYNDRMELFYAAAPFPLSTRGPGYNFYYRIPAQLFMMDDQVKFPYGERNSTPRFVLKIYSPGNYEVEVKMPDMTHK